MLLRQIQCFCAVCETGSFTKAAQSLYITQSAVSQQMKNLETDLGVSLFKRRGRNLSLANAGKRFYEETSTILAQIDAAKKSAHQVGEEADELIK